ncbi:TPA: replication protein, partial [Escherichia coli]|nr:replication protein [Escherichia coli]
MAEDKPLTKQQQKTVEASAQIKQDPPKGNDLAFTHS